MKATLLLGCFLALLCGGLFLLLDVTPELPEAEVEPDVAPFEPAPPEPKPLDLPPPPEPSESEKQIAKLIERLGSERTSSTKKSRSVAWLYEKSPGAVSA